MPYVRISLMQPKQGQDERVHELLDELIRYYEGRPGYLLGYRLAHEDTGRVGRLGVWEREVDAEHAATTDHDMALRAQLNTVVEDGTHEELSFDGVAVPPQQ